MRRQLAIALGVLVLLTCAAPVVLRSSRLTQLGPVRLLPIERLLLYTVGELRQPPGELPLFRPSRTPGERKEH